MIRSEKFFSTRVMSKQSSVRARGGKLPKVWLSATSAKQKGTL